MKATIVGLFAVAVFGALAAAVQADPIQVTSGFYNAATGQFMLNGNGFSLTFASDFPELPCQPCAPSRNEPIAFGNGFSEDPFISGYPGTFNGISYPHTYIDGRVAFTVPAFSSDELSVDHTTLTAPFSMTGSLLGFTTSAPSPNPSLAFVNDTFTGSGTLTAEFEVDPTLPRGSVFDATNGIFQFQSTPPVTPEPTTLLLFGTGVGLIWRRVRA